MNILITVPMLSEGSGLSRYVLTLSEILNKLHKITVLTTHNTSDDNFGKIELAKINPDIRLISIQNTNKYLRYIKAIRIIRKISPDILINNYNGLIQYILPYINRNSKIIHVLHNDTDDFYRIGAINASKTTAWIAPTNAIRDHFNEYTKNSYADKVFVISHGVQSGLIHSKASKKLEIVFTGVLYEHKGVKELPEIIKGLLTKGIDLHFTIIGQGILEDWLKVEFSEEQKKGIVEFTGVIDHDEVYRRMSESDIFLYPTHVDAFGLVIAEAMINGAVPVVSHLKGITDNLIDNNENGFLIKEGDINAFTATIVNLYHEPNLRDKISNNACRRANKCFSLDIMKSTYLNFISKIK